LLLYYTGTSRLSSKIIEGQSNNIAAKQEVSLDAMFKLKEQALLMKEAVLKGRLDEVGRILDFGWQHKKRTAEGISNPVIDEIYSSAIEAGATGGKISGAGGGGYMFFFCPANTKYKVADTLIQFGGEIRRTTFFQEGLQMWSYDNKK
jgi:D-glycero-alpha-D-manno-heptose-7-phosphate kinase